MENNLKNRLFSTGIRIIAFALFPLIWFLTQAILFRELSKTADRWLLITLAILVGSSFIFILYLGMNKLISYAPKQYQEALFGAMFVGPAIFLLSLFLLYPAIRTIYLSFFDNRGENFIGLENYRWSITDPAMLITIRNQVFWLIGVVFLVILFGLVVAYLSDRLRRGESFFKSIIFMPMAISAVGSSAMYKFIYEYRPPPLTQIGLINGLRVSRGFADDGSKCGNNTFTDSGEKIGYPSEGCEVPIGWLQQRDLQNFPLFENLDPGSTFLNLLSNLPLNTILLMFIMVWMFTGFAMVVFSAAIKAIPEEIVEAGRIDGATEGRIFLSVIMPYIRSTIIVVATYLTISVLKAFDIVFVTTRGDFESNLLAVKMLDEYFKFLNQGRSASVAVIIFICVIPVILLNVFRNKAENTV